MVTRDQIASRLLKLDRRTRVIIIRETHTSNLIASDEI